MGEPQMVEWTCALCGEVMMVAPEYGSSLSHEMHVELSRLRADLTRALDALVIFTAEDPAVWDSDEFTASCPFCSATECSLDELVHDADCRWLTARAVLADLRGAEQ